MSQGEMTGGNVLGGKCPRGKMSGGERPGGEDRGGNAQGGGKSCHQCKYLGFGNTSETMGIYPKSHQCTDVFLSEAAWRAESVLFRAEICRKAIYSWMNALS